MLQLEASKSLMSSYLIQPSEVQSVNFECQQWWTVKSKTCTQRKQILDKI